MLKFFSGLMLYLLAGQGLAQPVLPAELHASWWLDGSAGRDVSGLAFCGGELLAVSDKNSRAVYAVRFEKREAEGSAARRARLQPHLRIAGLGVPAGAWASGLQGLKAALLGLVQSGPAADFEGLSCGGDGIYLVSERYHRLARLLPDGTARWEPGLWAGPARERGYMQHFNAAAEGLARAGGDTWVALERQGRGLVRLSGNEPEFFDIPPVPDLDFRGRAEDITGLDIHDGALYTLERNAHAVCRRSLADLGAQWCIDYRAVEEAPEYVYRETRYGKAEGLAVSEEGIFVVLDNNNIGRAADPDDRRGLLLQFAHPRVPRLKESPQQ